MGNGTSKEEINRKQYREQMEKVNSRKYDREFAKKYKGPIVLYIEPDSEEESFGSDFELDENDKRLAIDIINRINLDVPLE